MQALDWRQVHIDCLQAQGIHVVAADKDAHLFKNLHTQLQNQAVLFRNRDEDIRKKNAAFSVGDSGKGLCRYNFLFRRIVNGLVIDLHCIILDRIGQETAGRLEVVQPLDEIISDGQDLRTVGVRKLIEGHPEAGRHILFRIFQHIIGKQHKAKLRLNSVSAASPPVRQIPFQVFNQLVRGLALVRHEYELPFVEVECRRARVAGGQNFSDLGEKAALGVAACFRDKSVIAVEAESDAGILLPLPVQFLGIGRETADIEDPAPVVLVMGRVLQGQAQHQEADRGEDIDQESIGEEIYLGNEAGVDGYQADDKAAHLFGRNIIPVSEKIICDEQKVIDQVGCKYRIIQGPAEVFLL